MLSFIGGIVGGFFAKIGTWILTWFAAKHAGEEQQHADDLEATQKAEQQAADAASKAETDPDYAQKIRDRYTDRGNS
jgi:hypothetical protein